MESACSERCPSFFLLPVIMRLLYGAHPYCFPYQCNTIIYPDSPNILTRKADETTTITTTLINFIFIDFSCSKRMQTPLLTNVNKPPKQTAAEIYVSISKTP
jgi:hypothetical protein